MSPAKKALLYWNTVRYLKPIQIYRRFWFGYHRPSLNLATPSIASAKQQGVWQPPVAHPQTMLESDSFRFLNRVEHLTVKDSWNNPNSGYITCIILMISMRKAHKRDLSGIVI